MPNESELLARFESEKHGPIYRVDFSKPIMFPDTNGDVIVDQPSTWRLTHVLFIELGVDNADGVPGTRLWFGHHVGKQIVFNRRWFSGNPIAPVPC